MKEVLNHIDTEPDSEQIVSLGKLELSVTHKCPFNCTYCSKKHHKEDECLTLDEKKKVILDAYKLGSDTLTLTGGEPLCDEAVDETLELMKFAKEVGYKRRVILTSGYGIIENFSEIKRCGVIQISIFHYKPIYRHRYFYDFNCSR